MSSHEQRLTFVKVHEKVRVRACVMTVAWYTQTAILSRRSSRVVECVVSGSFSYQSLRCLKDVLVI